VSRIRVVPIVEGHGEQASAIRTLLTRVWTEVVGGDYLECLRPIRIPRTKLIQPSEIVRAIDLALLMLGEAPSEDPAFVLVIFDADEDCPARLSTTIRKSILENRSHVDVAVVIANVEFETWFVAAAESLNPWFDLSRAKVEDDPEGARQGKAAVRRWMAKYSETLDQPRLTATMDLRRCGQRSPSFDKLCRELEARRR
jgi:hypothetical protein